MKIKGKEYRAVWLENNKTHLIDQLILPHEFGIHICHTWKDAANAIKTMIVRGAPSIGATACYGLAQAVLEYDLINKNPNHPKGRGIFNVLNTSNKSEDNATHPIVANDGVFKTNKNDDFFRYITESEKEIAKTRPTAYDLFHALEFLKKKIIDVYKKDGIFKAKEAAILLSNEYADNTVAACKKIGEYGNSIIKDNFRILTHCNAGALATVDFGTALAPIRIAHYNGKKIFVFADETRPRLQGAKLTAFELAEEGIDHAIIPDNAAGFYMYKKEIDMVIVGADRIAVNGDAANKIGTYEKAVVAKENNIPFYVAAPMSTIDPKCKSGKEIVIEERDGSEVSHINGIYVANKKSPLMNPGFDVTPARYITGIITEKGIYKPQEIRKLFDK